MILRFLSILCAFVLASQPLMAAPRDELNKVEQQLDQHKQKAEALDEKARETSESLKDLRQKLIGAAAAMQDKEKEQEILEDRLDELTRDIDSKSGALKEEKEKLNRMTDAMIELSRQPPESEFLQNDLSSDHVHRAILLRSILPKLREQTEAIARDLTSLNDLQDQMAEQKRLVIAARANLQNQQKELDQLIKTRQGLLQKTEEQKEAIAKQLASLTNEAKDLHQLLDKVTPKKRVQPRQPNLRSSLKPPVAGNIKQGYGAKDADGVISQGLTFTALSGSPVVAPKDGKVVFAGPFRGYGKILILQHDSGYHSFLAGFGRIDADMGQEVETGEPLGVLPVKTGGKPELYFEWRHDNEAVDPTDGIALSKSR
ncbi:MAG: peptidoglycan DD-metalloendopeptidase family protein [Alphaproteobacteria bacterium]